MNNIPGLQFENIVLVCLSYFLILLVNRRTNSESALLLVALLTFHHVVAYLYGFYLSTPQNETDPVDFLYLASECTKYGYCGYFGEHLYANYLAKMLAVGNSIYFVFLLNVLFFVISLYYFIRMSEFFGLKGNRKVCILLYSIWPSVVYFTTLNYREPFELYLLIAGVYFGLTGSKSDSFLRMLASMLLLLLMGMFHIKGLLFLSPVLFVIVVSQTLPLTVLSLGKKIILLVMMSIAVYSSNAMNDDYLDELWQSKREAELEKLLLANPESQNVYVKEKALSGNALIFEQNKEKFLSEKAYPESDPGYIDALMRKVVYYRASLTWVTRPQTAFLSTISDKSIPAFIATYSLVYLEYLFSPFIFQVNSFHSLLAYAESVLRLILFASTLVMLKRNRQTRILFIIYLAITAMWAIGVISFGASIRHHAQTNWILILLGVPIISEYISSKFRVKNEKMDVVSR
jgi:hypothetical protein